MNERFRWSTKLITFLISLYRKQKLLYNTEHPDYANRIKRERAMASILAELQKVEPNVRMHFLKAKVSNLRTQYMKERKKALSALKDDSSEEYEPTLWCYSQLTFLKKHCKISHLIPNLDKDDDYCSPDEEDNQSENFATVYPVNISNEVAESSDKDNYVIPNTLPNSNNSSSVPPANLRIVSCKSMNEGNNVSSSDKNKYPTSKRSKEDVANLEQQLKKQIENIKDVLASRVGRKQSNNYDWLGKQVVFEISKISNEVLQEETAWAIQSILRRNVCKDRSLQHQERGQNKKQESSTPKNLSSIATPKDVPLGTTSNGISYEDPLAEAMQGLIDEDCRFP